MTFSLPAVGSILELLSVRGVYVFPMDGKFIHALQKNQFPLVFHILSFMLPARLLFKSL